MATPTLLYNTKGEELEVHPDDIEKAVKQGYRFPVTMSDPQGNNYTVHPADAVKALKKGWKVGQATPQFDAQTRKDAGETQQQTDSGPRILSQAADYAKKTLTENPILGPAIKVANYELGKVREGARATKALVQQQAADDTPWTLPLPVGGPNVSGVPYVGQPNEFSQQTHDYGPEAKELYKKYLAPAAEASANVLEGQYQPENLLTLGAFKYLPAGNALLRSLKTGAGAYYGVNAAQNSGQKIGQGLAAAEQGNTPEAVKNLAEGAFSGGMALDTGRDVIRGGRQTVRDVADMGRATGRAIVQNTPASVGSRVFPESVQSTKQLGKTFARQASKQASNLSAALDMGGAAGDRGVRTHEDVAMPIVDAVRVEAVRQGKTAQDFKGRKGYEAAQELTSGVRQEYDDAYKRIVDPLRGDYAGDAALRAGRDVVNKLGENAALVDALTNSNNLSQLVNLKQEIASSRTIGDLENIRLRLNQLSSLFEGKSEAQQFQAPMFKNLLSEAANSIRGELYSRMARLYGGMDVNGEVKGISEKTIRQLQKEHGAAIRADQMMQDTARKLSARASEEAAPPNVFQRFRGLGYRMTMGSKQHAAAGVIEKAFPPSEVQLFNDRMKRVIGGAEGGEHNLPVPPITPEYVDPRTQGPTGSILGNYKLNAAPETLNPVARPEFQQGQLLPSPLAGLLTGSTENPIPPHNPARIMPFPYDANRPQLPPATLPESFAPPSNSVEAAGIPQTAEPTALQNRYEQGKGRAPVAQAPVQSPKTVAGTPVPSVTKEPWQQTLAESLGKREGEVNWVGNADPNTPAGQAHRAAVEQAIAEGKPVPSEVLKDYPDLQKSGVKSGSVEIPKGAGPESTQPKEIGIGDLPDGVTPKSKERIAHEEKFKTRMREIIDEKLASEPSTPPASGGESAIQTGDIITDGLVNGRVTGEGSLKTGRKDIPAYKIEIVSGHAKGQTSVMARDDAKKVSGGESKSVIPGMPKVDLGSGVTKVERPASKKLQSEIKAQQSKDVHVLSADVPKEGKNFEGRYLKAALDPAKEAWTKGVPNTANKPAEEHWNQMVKADIARKGDVLGLRPQGLKSERLFVKVPDDGAFTIPNTPKAIDHALKAADKFAGPIKQTISSTPRKLSVPRSPQEFDNAAYIQQLRDEVETLRKEVADSSGAHPSAQQYFRESLKAAEENLAEALKEQGSVIPSFIPKVSKKK